ncbi:CPBP family intramembrane glutamic endopeptidase [Carboxylicivirga marina]|uniref:CPBP family intramembrane glutamic endopeptidase n=1 Tax=Carboxylicivirga marina TaxID=2800988 RepID=UPI0025918E7E|nr:type II CAAX endopeptidase family protein [uncultured Carboxylicivirga sp.]
MINEPGLKLQDKTDKELEHLSKELDYYFGEEKQQIIEEVKRRNSLKAKKVKQEKSVYHSKLELIIVLFFGFAFIIYNSTIAILYDYTSDEILVSNNGNYILTLYQIITLAIIGVYLKYRGWKLSDFNLGFKFRMILIAILLFYFTNLLINISSGITGFVNPELFNPGNNPEYTLNANWISLSMILVINSIYEESLLIGYLFKRLEKLNPIVVICFSMLIRLSFHTYQGWLMLFTIIPMALVYGIYYWKFKRLWPLIIAHGIHNLLVFLSLQYQWHEKLQSLNDAL